MFRGVLKWIVAQFHNEKGADDNETENTRFIPSILDASVRYAHGMSNTGVEGEIARIKEQAQPLEEQQRDKER